jgi:hypothetical protein
MNCDVCQKLSGDGVGIGGGSGGMRADDASCLANGGSKDGASKGAETDNCAGEDIATVSIAS